MIFDFVQDKSKFKDVIADISNATEKFLTFSPISWEIEYYATINSQRLCSAVNGTFFGKNVLLYKIHFRNLNETEIKHIELFYKEEEFTASIVFNNDDCYTVHIKGIDNI